MFEKFKNASKVTKALIIGGAILVGAALAVGAVISGAVSYTHLDVYKRQK